MSADLYDIRDYERKAKWRPLTADKCRHADDYKAIFAPYCSGGKPCRACTKKWDKAQAERRSNAVSNS